MIIGSCADVNQYAKKMESLTAHELESILNTCEWRWSIDGLPTTIAVDKIEQFVLEVAKYFVIIKCQPMLDQLIEGLKYCKVSRQCILKSAALN